MEMKGKIFKSIVVMALFLMVLTACGGQTAATPEAEAQAPEAVVEATATTASMPEPTAEVKEPVKLTFWNNWDSKNGETIQALVDEFNAQNPDIVVENVFQPYGEVTTLLQTSIVSGTNPDLVALDLILIPQLVATGAVEPLDSYIDADAEFDITDFYPLLAEYDVMEGARYAVPMSTNNMQLIWNKDLFKAAGLDPEVPPTTWDEMKAMAEQCQKKEEGIVGFEFFTQPTGEGITWQFQVWLWANGGEFLNADNSAAAFNTEQGLGALTYVSDMLAGNGSQPGPWGLFGEQKACMQLDGSWLFGYRTGAPFEWGIAPVPAPEGGQTASNVGGEHIFMFNNAKDKEAAWKFIKFMTSAETQLKWDMETGFLPVRKAVGENSEYIQWVNETEPRMLPFVEGMPYAHTRPATPYYFEVSDAFSREIQLSLLGEVSPADALAAAEQAVNEVLSQ